MAPRVPRPQEFFFYDSNWNATYEKEFILKLSNYAISANSTLGRSDVIPIRKSMTWVNGKHGTSFTRKDAHHRFKQLQHRHEVFGYLVTLPLVHYDANSNVVTAPPFVWDYITMKYPIAEAYMRFGEAQWTEMYFVFGMPKPVDVFEDRKVIQISDDHSIPRSQPINPQNVGPVPAAVSDSPPSIPSAFWDDLSRIVSRSDVASQNSVQYPPPRPTAFIPNELLIGAPSEGRSSGVRARQHLTDRAEPSTGDAVCSSHASSATPKKPSRNG